jgi:hypothetical protein
MRELLAGRLAGGGRETASALPIALCDFATLAACKEDSVTSTDLAEEVRQYFIPDFSRWKDHDRSISPTSRACTSGRSATS